MSLAACSVAIALAAGLAMAEILLRFAGAPPASFLYGDGTPIRDVQTDWNVTYGMTGSGYRRVCSNPANAARRVDVIGDSFTFGYGLADCDDLVSQLHSAHPDAQFVNFAQPGMGIEQYLLIARDLVRRDATDVVILFYGNDVSGIQTGPSLDGWLADNLSFFGLLRNVERRILIEAQLGWGVFGDKNNAAEVPRSTARLKHKNFALYDSDAGPERRSLFRVKYRQLIAVLRGRAPRARIWIAMAPESTTASGAFRRFVVDNGGAVSGFHTSNPNYELVRQLSQESAVPFIDLAPQFFSHQPDDLYFPHDGHWSPEGARLAAQSLGAAMWH